MHVHQEHTLIHVTVISDDFDTTKDKYSTINNTALITLCVTLVVVTFMLIISLLALIHCKQVEYVPIGIFYLRMLQTKNFKQLLNFKL